jgi:hypothetical protein
VDKPLHGPRCFYIIIFSPHQRNICESEGRKYEKEIPAEMGHFLCDILQRRRRIRYFAALFELAPPRLSYYEQQGDKGFCPEYPQTPARLFSHT